MALRAIYILFEIPLFFDSPCRCISTAVSTLPPAAGLTPLTWLGTPKDFWGIAVGALLSTVAACALVIVNCVVAGAAMDRQHVTYPDPSLHGAFEGRYLSFLRMNHD